MDTPGKRLRWALDVAKKSNRRFSDQLTERGVYGASYPSVMRYLKDEREARRDFWESAALILGVRQAWLESGEGGPQTTIIHFSELAEKDVPDWVPDSARYLYLNTAIRLTGSFSEKKNRRLFESNEDMETWFLNTMKSLEQITGKLNGHRRDRMLIHLIQAFDHTIPLTAADRDEAGFRTQEENNAQGQGTTPL